MCEVVFAINTSASISMHAALVVVIAVARLLASTE